MTGSGWVALGVQLVGTLDRWPPEWDQQFHPTKARAVEAGLARFGHADFTIGHVVDGRLTWYGWPDNDHPLEDYADVASAFGWTPSPQPAAPDGPGDARPPAAMSDRTGRDPVRTPVYDQLVAEHGGGGVRAP